MHVYVQIARKIFRAHDKLSSSGPDQDTLKKCIKNIIRICKKAVTENQIAKFAMRGEDVLRALLDVSAKNI